VTKTGKRFQGKQLAKLSQLNGANNYSKIKKGKTA